MKRTFLLTSCAFVLIVATRPRLGAQSNSAPTSESVQSTTTDSTARDPHSVQPERPTVATHAGTVARGWIEMEEGGEWDTATGGKRTFFAPTNLKIGLGSHAQLNLLVNVVSDPDLRRAFAAGDITVGVKYRILDDHPVLGDFAILPAIKLPTASRNEAGTGTTDFSLLLISSHQFGPVAMDLNVGQTLRNGDGTAAPKTASVWTASFGFPIKGGPMGAAIEVFGYPGTSGPASANGTAALLIGPTYLLRDWLALDAGIIAPITGPQARAFYAGFVWNIGCVLPGKACRR